MSHQFYDTQFRALSEQIYQTSEHHKFVREQVLNQVGWHSSMTLSILVWWLWYHGLIWFHGASMSIAMFSVKYNAIFFIWISWSHTLRYMRDMFLWLMQIIWRRCPSIFLLPFELTRFLLEIFASYYDCFAGGIRNGEWGDHVTLQAAADSVRFINLSLNLLALIWNHKKLKFNLFVIRFMYAIIHESNFKLIEFEFFNGYKWGGRVIMWLVYILLQLLRLQSNGLDCSANFSFKITPYYFPSVQAGSQYVNSKQIASNLHIYE